VKILKWTVPVDDKPHSIGAGDVVHVDNQHGELNEVQVWTFEDPQINPYTPYNSNHRVVQVFGTGQELPSLSHPLGSAIVAGGQLVWHVVELPLNRATRDVF